MALSVQSVVFRPVEPVQAIKSPRAEAKVEKARRKRAKPEHGKGAFLDIDA